MRPRLLDAFSGAGGAAMGYSLAGFDVTGVDNRPMPRYPFRHIVGDALEYIREHGAEYDAIHASVPCQGYSRMRHLPWLQGREYPMLIGPTRDALNATGLPWVIENVEDAPLFGITLCGTMFNLKVYRHRKFEANWLLMGQRHCKHQVRIGPGRMLNDRAQPNADGWVSLPSKGTLNRGPLGGMVTVAGHQNGRLVAGAAMGIDWMTRDELSQAIPPAYTRFIGEQLRDHLDYLARAAS